MFISLVSTAALLIGSVLAIPAFFFGLQCFAGAAAYRRRGAYRGERPSVAVIVPAHNEESCIGPTLRTILPQLRAGDRMVVVTDNCTDRTAAVARSLGAEVHERTDGLRRGKGYALDAGIRYLAAAPCSLVLFVDADCALDAGAMDGLAAIAAVAGRPVQGRNLMKAPAGAAVDVKVAEFAYVVKNLVRTTGLLRLGLPCQLMGTGMVIPWHILRKADLASGNIVEDMKLAFDVAQMGHAPTFCPEFGIVSFFPESEKGAISQRRRWERGHLEMIGAALRHLARPGSIRTWSALALLIDRMILPVTLLFAVLAGWTLLTLAMAVAGLGKAPFLLAAASLAVFLFATATAWFQYGRSIVPAHMIWSVPGFVLRKLARYPTRILGNRGEGWVRTDRGK
jgi:cellulose synthase/poly-beta-1,6-N-acetylglucosamine synthase-like glycosyltransferase